MFEAEEVSVLFDGDSSLKIDQQLKIEQLNSEITEQGLRLIARAAELHRAVGGTEDRAAKCVHQFLLGFKREREAEYWRQRRIAVSELRNQIHQRVLSEAKRKLAEWRKLNPPPRVFVCTG